MAAEGRGSGIADIDDISVLKLVVKIILTTTNIMASQHSGAFTDLGKVEDLNV